jgi:hypothetical protein
MDCIRKQCQTAGQNATDDLHNGQQDINRNSPKYPGVPSVGIKMAMMSRQLLALPCLNLARHARLPIRSLSEYRSDLAQSDQSEL